MRLLLIVLLFTHGFFRPQEPRISKEILFEQVLAKLCNAKVCGKCAKVLPGGLRISSDILRTCRVIWMEPRCCFNRLHVSL